MLILKKESGASLEQVIYVDVLVVLNYIINWFLLKSAARLCGQRIKGIKAIIAALVGAMASLIIFVPDMNVFFWLVFKIAVSLIMAAIAFKYNDTAGLIKLWFIFFNVSLVFAGFMYAVYSSMGDMVLWYNGIVYFDISPITLVVCSCVAYTLIWIFDKLYTKFNAKPDDLKIIISHRGKKVTLNGIQDTGNRLCEPFSGLPVIVCGLETLLPLIPIEWIEWVCCTVAGRGGAKGVPSGCRLVSFRGIGANGMLPAFKPDNITVTTSSGAKYYPEAFIALSDSLSNGKYSAVVNPEVFKVSI